MTLLLFCVVDIPFQEQKDIFNNNLVLLREIAHVACLRRFALNLARVFCAGIFGPNFLPQKKTKKGGKIPLREIADVAR
jgi:hypothetical protein